jgi:hypothetical protein
MTLLSQAIFSDLNRRNQSGTRRNNSPGCIAVGMISTESSCGMSPGRISRSSSAALNAANLCGSRASKVVSWISRAAPVLAVCHEAARTGTKRAAVAEG